MMTKTSKTPRQSPARCRKSEGELVLITHTEDGNVYQVELQGLEHRDERTLVLTTPRPMALADAG